MLCDVEWEDGTPVAGLAPPGAAPPARPAGRARPGRLRRHRAGVHRLPTTPTRRRGTSGYRDLEPANQYNVDYSLLGTARVEPLLRGIRNGMAGAGMYVESAKGECNLGQHEIAFRYAEALTTCDNHVIYKTGAKEIAAQEGMSLTFMAKYDEREGNSCHIHLSLRSHRRRAGAGRRRRARVLPADGALPRRPARLPARADAPARAEHQLLQAVRRRAASPRPPIAWGLDNRTCALRVVGHGESLRVENRVPGGDVNPYLGGGRAGRRRAARHRERAAAGAGVRRQRLRRPTSRRCRRRCATRPRCSPRAKLAREAFGDEVVDHYLNAARVELAAFDAAVTDWERVRGFERL